MCMDYRYLRVKSSNLLPSQGWLANIRHRKIYLSRFVYKSETEGQLQMDTWKSCLAAI